MSNLDISHIAGRSPAENIARIRTVLGTGAAELANAVGIERQIASGVRQHDPVDAKAAARLANLAAAAEVLAGSGIAVNATLLKRKFARGMTLLQLVKAGGDAYAAAQQFVELHKRDAAQRIAMQVRIANRGRAPAACFGLALAA
jgi:predicted TIM-barrel enzyme